MRNLITFKIEYSTYKHKTMMSKNYIVNVICLSFLAGSIPISSAAQADPSTILVPYSSSASRTIGDSVNILFPYTPLGRCVSYQAKDLNWDSEGAISSDGTVALLSAEQEDKSTTEMALGFQTNSKINAGIFNANSSFDTDLTKDEFRSQSSRQISVMFYASADYGRRLIQGFTLDPTAPSPSSDVENFRKRCGTHFIRGERRSSDLTIIVKILTTSQQGKDAVTAHLKKVLGGGVNLKDISGEGGATLTASYKSIIEFAKKTGNVSIDYKARGGPGIAAAGAAARLVDPADFVRLSDIVSNVSSLFNRDNSGITSYVLQSNIAFGAPSMNFDAQRVEKIGSLTRTLLSLNNASDRYEKLKNSSDGIFNQYFKTYQDSVNARRDYVVQRINDCAASGSCDLTGKDPLKDVVFVEDMFKTATVKLSCQYQKASNLFPVIGKPAEDPEVLESISINIEGLSHTPDLIDFKSTGVARLTEANVAEDLSSRFSGFSLSKEDKNNEKHVFGTIYSENIDPKKAIAYDMGNQKFIIDQFELQRKRSAVLDSAYSIFAPGPNGIKVTYDVGLPPRAGCSVLNMP